MVFSLYATMVMLNLYNSTTEGSNDQIRDKTQYPCYKLPQKYYHEDYQGVTEAEQLPFV